MVYIKLYLLSLVSLIGLDAIWLGKIAPKLYQNNIGHLLSEKPNWLAAGSFYAVFIFGIVYFAVYPAYLQNSIYQAALKGALLGLVAYATFDLTNMAVMKDWPLKITAIDIIWGTILTGSVSALATYLALRFVK